eukprot:m.48571 g.48571  ORF g.48571 m.48571 type:complete len:221 (-) comp13298_c0_seq1:39-701(-)
MRYAFAFVLVAALSLLAVFLGFSQQPDHSHLGPGAQGYERELFIRKPVSRESAGHAAAPVLKNVDTRVNGKPSKSHNLTPVPIGTTPKQPSSIATSKTLVSLNQSSNSTVKHAVSRTTLPRAMPTRASFSVTFAEHRFRQFEISGLDAIIPNRTWDDIVYVCRPRVFNPALTITPAGEPWLYARFVCFGGRYSFQETRLGRDSRFAWTMIDSLPSCIWYL